MLSAVPQTKPCSTCKADLSLESFGAHKRGLFGRKSECKKCLSNKESVRRAADPEACKAYKRSWWAARGWSQDERAKAALKARNWFQANKTRRAKTFKSWRIHNPDTFKVIQKRYLTKSPVHIRRREHFLKVEKTLTPLQWASVLELFDYRCAYCLRNDLPMTMDHMIPISKGGPHTEANVVPACKSCNSSKNDRPIWVMANVKEMSHG